MKIKLLAIITFLAGCLPCFGQTKIDLNINFMLRGHIYAQSSAVENLGQGGFAVSDNLPKKINDSLSFQDSGLILKIDTMIATTIDEKYNGYRLFIANTSDTIVKLKASDSRLYAIAEVFYKGEWKPIEYLPISWCGNSYHVVFLNMDEYWTFNIPKFTGKIKTKLRYKLMIGTDKYIYSNEIPTSINKGQLKEKQGHKPTEIMDPYSE